LLSKETDVQVDKKTTVLVWASVAAAAAGIAVTAILFKCRNKICDDDVDANVDHRHLQQVLSDCYNKIQEIEARLPSVIIETASAKTARTVHTRTRAANGKPALET
jgi:hypothetical protein